MQSLRGNQTIEYVVLSGLLLLAVFIYWPGLYGPFLFDDYANLAAIGEYGGIRDWETFRLFVLGNHSGPTGRPVSMLSFVLNSTQWPTDPWPFKFTNLVLHLINAVLIYRLTRLIVTVVPHFGNAQQHIWIALLSSGIWLLHPFNISTVLYPVQRMSILSAMFMLSGIYLYIHARMSMTRHPKTSYIMISVAVIAGTVLATLSKENGALLPVLILCVEYVVLSNNTGKLSKSWNIVFLWLPILLLVAFFIYYAASGMMAYAYEQRHFTLMERLLTQPRIITEYLYYWFIPHISHTGLLSQNYIISKSLLEPITTIPAILLVFTLIIFAAWLRKRAPLFSLAVLFYFCGHLMESTFIPLELYYEHRNYLPSIFLWLPFVAMLFRYLTRFTNSMKFMVFALCLSIFAFLTSVRAEIWSSEEALAYHWADSNPTSQRAQRHAAIVALKNNKYALAIDILAQAKLIMPENIAVHLHWLTLICQTRDITDEEKQYTTKLLSSGYFSFKNFTFLENTFRIMIEDRCSGLNFEDAYRFLDALKHNAGAVMTTGPIHQILFIEGILALEQDRPDQASELFRRSIKTYGNIDAAIVQVGLLASSGHPQMAQTHLDFIEANFNLESYSRPGKLDYRHEINVLRKKLQHE